MSADFTPITLHYLHRSGWVPNRQVSVGPAVTALEAEGYPVSEAAREFLKQFGGLTILFPHHQIVGQEDDLRVDPLRAIQGIWPERVAKYSERAGEELCLVGEVYRGHMALLMGASGRLYAGADELLLLLGASARDALDGLCRGAAPTELPDAAVSG